MSRTSTAAKAETEEMNEADTTLVADDSKGAGDAIATEHKEAQPQFAELLQKVVAETGKGYGSLMRDMFRYCLGGNKLTAEEYLNLRLYQDGYSPEQKAAFVGIAKSRDIWLRIYKNSRTIGTIIDKLAAEALFRGAGFPVARTLGACNLRRNLPGIAGIDSAVTLEGFLSVHANQRLFGKPANMCQSIGAMAIERFDAAGRIVHLADGNTLKVSDLWQVLETNFQDGYLFQERLTAHPDIAKVCGDKIATARILTIDQDAEPDILAAIWKVPTGKNIADNFWRSGNILTSVDIESGVIIESIRGLGLNRKTMAAHPDSNEPIIGLKLPDWQAAKAMVLSASQLLNDTWMIGWDVAFTPDGPVIVEANETPDLQFMQFVSGEGILTPRFNEFIEWADQKNLEFKKVARQKLIDASKSESARLLGGATRF